MSGPSPPPQRKRARTAASTGAMIAQALLRSGAQQDSIEGEEAAKNTMKLKKGRRGGERGAETTQHGEDELEDVMVIVGDADSGNSSVTASASELLHSGTEDCDDTSLDSDADVDVANCRMIKVRRRPGLTETDREVLRLVVQSLKDIGLSASASVLLAEAGIELNHKTADSFKNDVLSGDWNQAVKTLEELKCHLKNPRHLVEMKFLLFEQKYLEFLSQRNLLEALKVLQAELTPLRHRQARLHELSSFLMLTKSADLARVTRLAKGKTSRLDLVERLQAFLPASVMLPPRRLMTLLSQAQQLQEERCLFHNQALSAHELDSSCLANDHQCSERDIPSRTVQVLTDHLEEVWYCQFSPDGLKLATGSKDATVMLWDMDPINLEFKRSCTLQLPTRSAHDLSQHGIACFAWSPDSSRLAVCGAEDCDEVIVFKVDNGQKDARIQQSHEDALTTVSWSPDGNKIACGGTRGNFYQCDSKGNIVDAWEGIRVVCLQYRSDGHTILAADTHNRIRSYNFEDLTDTTIIQEDNGIMSFSLDATDRYAVLNVATQGLHMWDIEERCLVRRFVGINQGHYTLYSCFGGLANNFVASGSEENNVFIYHVKKESPVAVLRGHSRTVNCVAWNPVYREVLVSASDDGTVRVWGSPKDEESVYTNGDGCSSRLV